MWTLSLCLAHLKDIFAWCNPFAFTKFSHFPNFGMDSLSSICFLYLLKFHPFVGRVQTIKAFILEVSLLTSVALHFALRADVNALVQEDYLIIGWIIIAFHVISFVTSIGIVIATEVREIYNALRHLRRNHNEGSSKRTDNANKIIPLFGSMQINYVHLIFSTAFW